MARVGTYLPLYPWSGGLNTSIDPIILDPKYLTVADNITLTNSGARKKRGGQARYNSSQIGGSTAAETVVYLADYWATVSNAKREYFVALTTAGEAYRSAFDGTWSNFSTLTLNVSQGGVTHTVINEDLLLGLKGTSSIPVMWNNQSTSANLVTLTASSGSLPFTNAWILQNYIERLWVAGDQTNPDRVYVSRVGDHQRWTASATAGTAITLDVGIGDGDPDGVTALIPSPAGDRVMYAMKRKHVYRIDCSASDQTTWSITKVSDQIGCINPNAWAAIDQSDVIFLSDRGVHTLSQVVSGTQILPGQFLSFPIQYDYKSVIDSTTRSKISATYNPDLNSFLFGCKRSGQSTYETVYGYNIELKEWFRWTSVPCNFLMTRFNKTDGTHELYAAANSGYVNQLNQTTLNDFNSPIVTRLKSTFIAPSGVPFQDCQFTNLALVYRAHENSTFRVYLSIDGLNTTTLTYDQKIAGGNTLGTTSLGSGFLLGNIQAIKPVWNHVSLPAGASIQITIEQDGLNQDLELYGLVLEYEVDEEAQNAFTSSLYS